MSNPKYIDADKFWNRLISVSENDWVGFDTIDEVLSGMPAEPRWIPVTERLPELYTDVLLSVRQGYAFGEPDNWCVVGQLIDKLDITWATNYGFHDVLYSNGIKHTVWVSAWMPLPEPYKGGAEE